MFRPICAACATRHQLSIVNQFVVAVNARCAVWFRRGGPLMKPLTLIGLFVAWAVCATAHPSPDLEKEKAELLRRHTLDREAHFKTDVDLLMENAPEEFIAVSRGKISRSSKADARKMFIGYF